MGRPKVTKDELTVREQAQIATNAQENALHIGHSLAGLTAEPVNLFDTEAVERRTMEYIADCQRTGTRVTPPGLALWLGITSEDLKNWLTGFGNDEQRRTALRINQFLHANFADNALLNKTSPALSAFILKNWFGYKENPSVESAESVEKTRSLDELQKEAESLPDFEIIETQGKKGNK